MTVMLSKEDLATKLKLLKVFCDHKVFNKHHIEYPWYSFWQYAIEHDILRNTTKEITVGPQLPLASDVKPNEGVAKERRKFPDAVMFYLAGKKKIEKLRTVEITVLKKMLLVEIKRLPLDESTSKRKENIVSNAIERAQESLEIQAAKYFASQRDIREDLQEPQKDKILGLAAADNYWTWTTFSLKNTVPASRNQDGTYRGTLEPALEAVTYPVWSDWLSTESGNLKAKAELRAALKKFEGGMIGLVDEGGDDDDDDDDDDVNSEGDEDDSGDEEDEEGKEEVPEETEFEGSDDDD